MNTSSNRIDDLSPEKRALLAKHFRTTSNAAQLLVSEPIAVIGIGCHFPGETRGPDAFWSLLRDGIDAITDIPAERRDFNKLADLDPDALDNLAMQWGGYLKDIDQFDASFFGIAPREAMAMDPQQRLFLEVAWEALEHAGQPIDRLAGSKTGVFVGVSNADYGLIQGEQQTPIDMYYGTGSALNILAGRLSYLLDLRGPCMTVDTACSSSLVAVHMACQSLHLGESQLALAGGVNLVLSARGTINMARMGIMASDGRCKTFDALANGFVRGEGCGVVVLKRLSDAIADGDAILALVRGSAVNQDGRSSALTAPNVQSQKALIRSALAHAGVAPAQISYVETHGTGTVLGDPIEVEALTEVIGQRQPDGQPCWLGAVKTNVGHLESAAGIAGFIKAVLALQHEAIPPNLHLRTLNPHIALEQTRFALPTTLQPWPATSARRYAGVSSFGWSGTNAHVVLEEAPRSAEQAGGEAADHSYMLPLSARSAPAVTALARSYYKLLSAADAPALRDLCYSASLRRMHHEHRLTVVGSTAATVAEQLQRFLEGALDTSVQTGATAIEAQPKLVFVFPGQGSQWLGMGCQLLDQEPVFREAIEACAVAFQPYISWSLLEQMRSDVAPDRIDVIQPLLFAIAVGLSALWQSWGLTPDAVIGHSMGEIAAARVAGALTLDDAARIICGRSKLLRGISGQGAMAMVELPLAEAQAALAGYEDRASVAVSNSPRSTVIAGEPAALEEIIARLEARQVFCRRVKVDVAAHSPQVDPLTPALSTLLAGLNPQPNRIPFYSTVDQAVLDGRTLNGAYWMRNLRQPVHFATMIQRLAEAGHTLFIEISPHPILLPAIGECLHEMGAHGAVLPSLRRDEPERAALLNSLGAAYTQGYAVNWGALYSTKGRSVPLPRYPWQRERYWFQKAATQARPSAFQSGGEHAGHPLLQTHVRPADQPGTSYWEATVSLERLPYLADHQVQGSAVLPATAYLEMALKAAHSLFGSAAVTIEAVTLKQMLVLNPDGAYTLQLKIMQDQPETAHFDIASRAIGQHEATWTNHVSGLMRLSSIARPPAIELSQVIDRCPQRIAAADYYEHFAALGLEYGPAFQGIAEIRQGNGEALARLALSPLIAREQALYAIHPALLDASFQALDATFPVTDQRDPYLPVHLGQLCYYGSTDGDLWVYARSDADSGDGAMRTGNLQLLNAAGQVLVEAQGLKLQRLQAAQRSPIDSWLYKIDWLRQVRADPVLASPGSWLIFADRGGLGLEVANRLSAQGATCTVVLPGSGELAERDGYYYLDPTQPQLFRQLLHVVSSRGERVYQHVLFLWGIPSSQDHDPALNALEETQVYGALSALYLVQALSQVGWRNSPRLWLVTRGTQASAAVTDVQQPAAATLWGLGRTVMYEHPDLRCTLVDLSAAGAVDETNELVAELRANTAENQVALREAGRYVARLTRSHPAAESPAPAAALPIRADATYLLTGGLGGLGLTVAQWLVAQGARSLLLIGRRPPTAAQQPLLDALRDQGISLHIVAADVSDFAALAAALQDRLPHLPSLRGVFHAAGLLDDGVLLQQTAARFATVGAPKLAGSWNLHRLTAALPLDWFVLCSSAASLLGSPGQGNYAAANAFLDALAAYRQGLGLPALSINWGPWAEVGLAAARSDRGERLGYRGIGSIAPEQGVAVLGQLLHGAPPQVAVLPLNLRQWRQSYPQVASSPLFSALAHEEQQRSPDEQTPSIRASLNAADPAERQLLLKEQLRLLVAQVLRLAPERITEDAPFPALGFDSLMAIEFRNRLETLLEVVLPTTLVWAYPTLTLLTNHLAEKISLTSEAVEEAGAPAPIPIESHVPTYASLEELSEDEAEALLLAKLSRVGKRGSL